MYRIFIEEFSAFIFLYLFIFVLSYYFIMFKIILGEVYDYVVPASFDARI